MAAQQASMLEKIIFVRETVVSRDFAYEKAPTLLGVTFIHSKSHSPHAKTQSKRKRMIILPILQVWH